jgi:ATP-dependent protease ClpP protease subunit
MVALAFFDRIRSSSHEFIIVATGLVASAAVIILAAGDMRMMSKEAWVMVHEDEVLLDDSTRVQKACKDIKHYERLESQWNELLRQRTGTPAEVWADLHQKETYLDANECKRLGLVDKIYEK